MKARNQLVFVTGFVFLHMSCSEKPVDTINDIQDPAQEAQTTPKPAPSVLIQNQNSAPKNTPPLTVPKPPVVNIPKPPTSPLNVTTKTPIATTPTQPPEPKPKSLPDPQIQKPNESVPYARVDAKKLREEQLYYLKGSNTPFTGTIYKEFPNGKHSFEINCINGEAHGHLTQFHPNGNKSFQVPMQNNKAHGSALGWYLNGKKKSEYPYKDGVVHGVFSEWFQTGQIGLQASYVQGKLRGKVKGWYLDGTPYDIAEVLNDEPIRISAWYEPGSKWKEIGFRDGKLWGYYMDWGNKGELLSVKRYENGKLTKVIK